MKMKKLMVNRTINYSHPGYNHNYRALLFSPLLSPICFNNNNFARTKSTWPRYLSWAINTRCFSIAYSPSSSPSSPSTNPTNVPYSFDNIIPSEYVSSMDKPLHIYVNLSEITTTVFKRKVIYKLLLNSVYTVFVKVRYNYDSFFMAGRQFGFLYSSENNINALQDSVISRIEEYFDVYNLSDDNIIYIQVSFWLKDKKLLSEFSLGERPLHISNIENTFTKNSLSIPVSTNKDSLGEALHVTITNDIITAIHLSIKGERVNFLTIIKNKAIILRVNHQDKITIFDKNWKFYLLKDKAKYILAINKIVDGSMEKIRYSLDGVIISHVIDRPCNNYIIRSSGEKSVVIKDNKVVSINLNINLRPIEKPNIEPLFVENNNIGVIDLECYKGADGIDKVYALGFKTNLDQGSTIYYIDKINLDSDKIILSLVNELFRNKYSNITFYCHNLGGFDIVFILKVLYNFNDSIKDKSEHYKVSCILRDDKIIKVKISRFKDSFTIFDSYAMLADDLSKLGENFKVTTIKSQFPYRFAIKDHLFYKGVMPSISYYNKITEEEYDFISVPYWSFKDETIKYLNNDLYSLYEILTKANKQIFLDYNVNKLKRGILELGGKIYYSDTDSIVTNMILSEHLVDNKEKTSKINNLQLKVKKKKYLFSPTLIRGSFFCGNGTWLLRFR